MTTQTVSITDTLDDGYQSGASFVTSAPNYIGSGASDTGFTFRLTTQIAAGATINKCYFRVYRLTTSGGGVWGALTLKLENAAPSSNTRWSGSHLPASATMLTGGSVGTGENPASYQSQYLFGESDSLATNLTSDMQSLVTTYGTLNIGDLINVRVSQLVSGGYGELEDYAAAGGHLPQLVITWTAGAGGAAVGGRKLLLGVGA